MSTKLDRVRVSVLHPDKQSIVTVKLQPCFVPPILILKNVRADVDI